MTTHKSRIMQLIEAYDSEAEASGWYGAEIIFGLSYKFIKPGQKLLDIGIGTGLSSELFHKAGVEVHGMDVSSMMIDACNFKGFQNLVQHDLTVTPYPFEGNSMDLAICMGVMNFFSDLSPIFKEANRIIRKGSIFAFVVGDRTEDEPHAFEVGREHTHSEKSITMYKHSRAQIVDFCNNSKFSIVRELVFKMFMDAERKHEMNAKAYIVKK